MNAANEFDVAIVGMSGRFPGAPTLQQFWKNLSEGVESITRFSDEELLAAGVPQEWIRDPRYVKAAPILEEPGAFDAEFFRYTPAEARSIDPQQRILLELAYEALEDGGYDPERYSGRIGVFTGAAMNTYFLNGSAGNQLAENYIPTLIGADKDFLSTRIAYKLNLRGPGITVQTACSSSMVAVHLARQSLLCHETDMVLAGGISVRVPHKAGYFFDGGGVVSPDGHVRAFDAKSNGTVFGSGGGMLLLKRLSDAIADGDQIYAVIKGSAVNNDGSEKAGYTAPSVKGQAEAVIEAIANADVEADSISYVEAHGSGTPVGDPVEIMALTKAFRNFTDRSAFCAIGSVKTNVGHLDAAAAVTGIIKTVLALKNRKIPPSLHFSEPNAEINFAETPFFVNTQLKDWESRGPRRAGVMSTGMGGTNAHLVLEEAPEVWSERESRSSELIVLSANSSSALDEVSLRLRESLNKDTASDMGNVAYTLQAGRKAFPHRRFLVCHGREDAVAKLGSLDSREIFSRFLQEAGRRPIVLLLPGVGDHYLGMAHELYGEFGIFRDEVDRCAQLLSPHLGTDIRSILYPKGKSWEKESSSKGIDLKKLLGRATSEVVDPETDRLNKTRFVQPALFTIEYALAKLWASFGVVPDAIVGHSMGEYVAACLAGVFSLEDALQLVAARARLVDQLPQGRMLAVMLSEEEILPLLSGDVSISLINGPKVCVVAGPAEQVDQLEVELKRRDVLTRHVQNGHAFHSRMLDPIVDDFESEVRKVQLHEPKIPFISNVTGNWITAGEATSPGYWAKHANRPARFSDALQRLWEMRDAVLVEAGPGRTLSVLAAQHPGQKNASDPVSVSSLRHSYENGSDLEVLWQSIGKLWLSGANIEWEKVHRGGRRRVSLPTYPFERKIYWHTAEVHMPPAREQRANLDDWFYAPTWERSGLIGRGSAALGDAHWVVFSTRDGEGAGVRAKLESLGQPATLVRFGEKFNQRRDGSFELNPDTPQDYVRLLRKLKEQSPQRLNFLHLGGISSNKPLHGDSVSSSMQSGFYSLLYLAQAIAEVDITIPVTIGIVSSRLHQVTGDERLDPTIATLLGPCGVIPKEFSNIHCFNVDLPDDCDVEEMTSALSEAIFSEFAARTCGDVVAYRGKYRWERNYRQGRLPIKAGNSGRLRQGGVYLITGGTGGLGLTLARYLAETYKARIVLTQRGQFPEKSQWRALQRGGQLDRALQKKLDRILEIESLGAEVEVILAEASDRQQTKAALDFTLKRFGTLNGVIHAAGILRAGLISATTQEVAERVLAPKVQGTVVLAELLRKLKISDLDFLALFSSMSSITTPFAHCDYSAANAFLDAFANSSTSFHTVSINWPVWKEVGRLAEMDEVVGAEGWKEDVLNKGIGTEEALQAFERALNSGLTQVIVSPEPIEQVIRDAENFDPVTYFVSAADDGKRPAGANDSLARPTNDVEAKLAEIWSRTLGLDRIGIHENFFDLGGHSLLAASIVSQVERNFGKRLSITAIFRAPTIAQLAATIRGTPAPHIVPFHAKECRPNSLLWLGGGAIFNPLANELKDEPGMVFVTLPDESLAKFGPPYRMEDVACCMADKILEVDPSGPYIIGGWCLQGLLAYETARQLELKGRPGSLVVLVDTPLPTHGTGLSSSDRLRLRLRRELFHLARLWEMPRADRAAYLRGRLETLKVVMQYRRWKQAYETVQESNGEEQLLEEILFLASLNYRPAAFSGRMLFLQPELRPADRFWDHAPDWSSRVQRLDNFEVPGDHTSMFHEPNVAILAERVRQAIREMQPGGARLGPVSTAQADLRQTSAS